MESRCLKTDSFWVMSSWIQEIRRQSRLFSVPPSLGGLTQDFVAHSKRIFGRCFFCYYRQEAVVWNNHQSVIGLFQLVNSLFGNSHSLLSFEEKGFCRNTDG